MKHPIHDNSAVTIQQFAVFRALFGLFLSWHFLALVPYAGEIFSDQGITNRDQVNPFRGKWPNPFFVWGSTSVIQISLIIGGVCALLFSIGKFWRTSAIYLWLLHASLFTANPLTANPSLGYIGLMLLLCVIIPRNSSTLPTWIPRTAWILMAVGYSFSGVLKLSSPSWVNGSALNHLLENPLARPGFARDLMLGLPDSILVLMTWSVLLLELIFVLLVCFKNTRLFTWLAMLFMHLGIMLTVDFTDLSLGMVMIHLFTFRAEWWQACRKIYFGKIKAKHWNSSTPSKNLQLTNQ